MQSTRAYSRRINRTAWEYQRCPSKPSSTTKHLPRHLCRGTETTATKVGSQPECAFLPPLKVGTSTRKRMRTKVNGRRHWDRMMGVDGDRYANKRARERGCIFRSAAFNSRGERSRHPISISRSPSLVDSGTNSPISHSSNVWTSSTWTIPDWKETEHEGWDGSDYTQSERAGKSTGGDL